MQKLKVLLNFTNAQAIQPAKKALKVSSHRIATYSDSDGLKLVLGGPYVSDFK